MNKSTKWVAVSIVILLVVIGAYVYFTKTSGIYSKQTPAITSSVDQPLAEASSSDSDWHYKCTEEQLKLPTSKGMTYSNTALRFSLYLPEGWILTTATDTDPHFLNCSTGAGFEIQGGYKHPGFQAPEDYYKLIVGNLSETKGVKIMNTYSSLVPGAVLTEYQIINPESGEGWPLWFAIIYPNQNIAFTMGASNSIDEYSFISTFKLEK